MIEDASRNESVFRKDSNSFNLCTAWLFTSSNQGHHLGVYCIHLQTDMRRYVCSARIQDMASQKSHRIAIPAAGEPTQI